MNVWSGFKAVWNFTASCFSACDFIEETLLDQSHLGHVLILSTELQFSFYYWAKCHCHLQYKSQQFDFYSWHDYTFSVDLT